MGACRDNGSIRLGKRKKLQLIGHRGNEFYGRRKERCIFPRSRAHMGPLRHFDIKYRCTDENLKSIVTTFGNATAKTASSGMRTRSPCSARHMPQRQTYRSFKVPGPISAPWLTLKIRYGVMKTAVPRLFSTFSTGQVLTGPILALLYRGF